MQKHKMTGCARFFIAIIILAPLAYLGASYYNGQDGIQNIKNLLGIGKHKADDRDTTYHDTAKDLSRDLEAKDQEIQKLREQNTQLQKENDALKKEIDNLKNPPSGQQ